MNVTSLAITQGRKRPWLPSFSPVKMPPKSLSINAGHFHAWWRTQFMKTSVKIPVLTPPPLHHPNTPPLRWVPQKLRPAENVTTSVTTSTAKMYNVHAVCYDVTTCTPPFAPPPSRPSRPRPRPRSPNPGTDLGPHPVLPPLHSNPSRSLTFARIFCANAADGFSVMILPP